MGDCDFGVAGCNLICCHIARELGTIVLSLFRNQWVTCESVFDLLSSWQGQLVDLKG